MKTRTLISSVSAVLLTLLCLSCSKDQASTLYEGSSGLAFASAVLNTELSAEDANQILVPVYRGTQDIFQADLSLEFETKDASGKAVWVESDPAGIFSLIARRVLFADESNVAYAQIRFTDINKLGVDTKYRMRLSIKDNLSPSQKGSVVITANRKLNFKYLGKCTWTDRCVFENSYKADIYKAEEADIYRVMDPYSEGLTAEEYAENGWAGTPSEYVQFTVRSDGSIYYEPFSIGMKVQGKYMTYAYYPSEYLWGKDFSQYDSENRRISETELQLYPVYCLPDFQYGFLNDGAYKLTILLP